MSKSFRPIRLQRSVLVQDDPTLKYILELPLGWNQNIITICYIAHIERPLS